MFTLRIIGRHFEDLYTPASYRFIHPSIGVPKILKVDLEVFLVCPSLTLLLETSGSMLLHFHKPIVDARNPAPADRVNILLFTKFRTSQFVQDFFHHQYHWPSTPTRLTVFLSRNSREVWCVLFGRPRCVNTFPEPSEFFQAGSRGSTFHLQQHREMKVYVRIPPSPKI